MEDVELDDGSAQLLYTDTVIFSFSINMISFLQDSVIIKYLKSKGMPLTPGQFLGEMTFEYQGKIYSHFFTFI